MDSCQMSALKAALTDGQPIVLMVCVHNNMAVT